VSGNIVNLRTYRKRKERAGREAEAAENRVRHGRTKAERHHDDARRGAADRVHDGRRLNPEADDPNPT
jgi:nucleotide-binding universal stress UspA family protein